MNMLDYFLKANLYAGLFAGCYWLLLRRHTFFGVNRAYLLASVVLSLTLPLVSLPAQTVATLPASLSVPVGIIALPPVTISTGTNDVLPTAVVTEVTETMPNWELVGAVLYGIVSVLLLLQLGRHVWKLLRLISASEQERRSNYTLVMPNVPDVPTFSFFRYLVLNPADAHSDLILAHELVHIRQWHSLDVLTMATLRAVFWGCPALWLLDRALREVHEFLADRVAICPASNQPARLSVEQYARFLVDYAFGVRPDVLTNGFFNPSLLKRRIQMMHQHATNRWALGKYALVLPLAFALLAMTTARQEVNALFNDTITVTGRVMNAADGKPLAGVNIVLKGGRLGVTTGADGKYLLAQLPAKASLVYSFVGFATKEVFIGEKKEVNVTLERSPNRLSGLVVTVYDTPTATMPIDSTSRPASLTGKTGEVFTVVEQQPEFPGGQSALGAYLRRTIRYPAKAKQEGVTGTVLVHFTVTAEGKIDDAYVEKGISGGCNEEAIRLVNQMPHWQPGKQNGKPVAVPYVMPVEFVIDKEDKRTGYEPRAKPLDTPIGDYPPARSGEFTTDTLPRSSTTIRIRGKGPLGALGDDQQPLYILDSLEIDKARLDQLDTKAIKSIEVLKGASASAYGEKGKDGVILITTKKP